MVQIWERYELLQLISPINTDHAIFEDVSQFHSSLKSFEDNKIAKYSGV